MTKVRAVIFDKDGTLFDFSVTWEAWAASFLRLISDTDNHANELGAVIGFNMSKRQFSKDSLAIAGTPGQIADALLPYLSGFDRNTLLNVLNTEAAAAPQAQAVPLKPFLTTLRGNGLKLGVVTNDAEKPARAHIESAGITDFFDLIIGSDSGFGAKPDAGQLLAFAKAVDVPVNEIVMVGDSLHDLVAAQRAGMRGVGVLTGLADAQTLGDSAEIVLPDIGHLPDWLKIQHQSGDG
ncbi:MAG: HAD family hydrolase [Roseobacter sp.]